LFRVPFTPPANAIGKNTADCLRSEIVFGYVGLVEGSARAPRSRALEPASPRVRRDRRSRRGTIARSRSGIERVDDDLTLEVCACLWEINAVDGSVFAAVRRARGHRIDSRVQDDRPRARRCDPGRRDRPVL